MFFFYQDSFFVFFFLFLFSRMLLTKIRFILSFVRFVLFGHAFDENRAFGENRIFFSFVFVRCWCGDGDSLDAEKKLKDEECDYPCAGDPDSTCGGFWRIAVYESG